MGAAVLRAVFAAQAGGGHVGRTDVVDGVQAVFAVAAPLAALGLVAVLALVEAPLATTIDRRAPRKAQAHPARLKEAIR